MTDAPITVRYPWHGGDAPDWLAPGKPFRYRNDLYSVVSVAFEERCIVIELAPTAEPAQ